MLCFGLLAILAEKRAIEFFNRIARIEAFLRICPPIRKSLGGIARERV